MRNPFRKLLTNLAHVRELSEEDLRLVSGGEGGDGGGDDGGGDDDGDSDSDVGMSQEAGICLGDNTAQPGEPTCCANTPQCST